MSLINCSVTKKDYESSERLINRFNKLVSDEGIMKDHKLNVVLTRQEREQFKIFASKRRDRKKTKRIKTAINS